MLGDRKGYTLGELATAMAVASIIGAVPAKMLSGVLAKNRVKFEVEKLQVKLHQARETAKKNLDCVEFEVRPHEIEIIPYDGCATATGPSEVVAFDDSVSLNSSSSSFFFTSTGGLLAGSGVKIEVTELAHGSVVKELEILPLLGLFRED